MKKLLLSLLTLVSLSAFAQKDLSVTLISPDSGQTIRKGTPFSLVVQFKNVGNDSIQVQDSLRLLFTLNGGPLTIGGGSVLTLSHPTIYKDSSVFFILNNLNFEPTETDSNAQICAVAGIFYNGSLDTVQSNNASCNRIILSDAWPTAVKEIKELAASVKAYPNPASSYFTITMKSTEATVDVMDITGKLVSSAPVVMGEARMDVSTYNNGIYFYQIKDSSNNVVKSGKFTVSH